MIEVREARGEKRDSYLRTSRKHSNHDGLVRVFFQYMVRVFLYDE